jgi:hypothetical protein
MYPFTALSLDVTASQFNGLSSRSLRAKDSICRNLRSQVATEAVAEYTADAVVPDDVTVPSHDVASGF